MNTKAEGSEHGEKEENGRSGTYSETLFLPTKHGLTVFIFFFRLFCLVCWLPTKTLGIKNEEKKD